MTDYISREEVLALAKDIIVPTKDGEYRHRCIDPNCVRELHAADVVEVVRCKNCENADLNGMGCCCVWCNEMQQAVFEDGWCYRGERMVNDDV